MSTLVMIVFLCSLSSTSPSSLSHAQEQQLLLSSEPFDLSNSSGDPDSPSIATFGNNVYVVWTDYYNNTPGPYDNYFARSTDGSSSSLNQLI
jgi:hypothetical protein